jgi:hypothetical protein
VNVSCAFEKSRAGVRMPPERGGKQLQVHAVLAHLRGA